MQKQTYTMDTHDAQGIDWSTCVVSRDSFRDSRIRSYQALRHPSARRLRLRLGGYGGNGTIGSYGARLGHIAWSVSQRNERRRARRAVAPQAHMEMQTRSQQGGARSQNNVINGIHERQDIRNGVEGVEDSAQGQHVEEDTTNRRSSRPREGVLQVQDQPRVDTNQYRRGERGTATNNNCHREPLNPNAYSTENLFGKGPVDLLLDEMLEPRTDGKFYRFRYNATKAHCSLAYESANVQTQSLRGQGVEEGGETRVGQVPEVRVDSAGGSTTQAEEPVGGDISGNGGNSTEEMTAGWRNHNEEGHVSTQTQLAVGDGTMETSGSTERTGDSLRGADNNEDRLSVSSLSQGTDVPSTVNNSNFDYSINSNRNNNVNINGSVMNNNMNSSDNDEEEDDVTCNGLHRNLVCATSKNDVFYLSSQKIKKWCPLTCESSTTLDVTKVDETFLPSTFTANDNLLLVGSTNGKYILKSIGNSETETNNYQSFINYFENVYREKRNSIVKGSYTYMVPDAVSSYLYNRSKWDYKPPVITPDNEFLNPLVSYNNYLELAKNLDRNDDSNEILLQKEQQQQQPLDPFDEENFGKDEFGCDNYGGAGCTYRAQNKKKFFHNNYSTNELSLPFEDVTVGRVTENPFNVNHVSLRITASGAPIGILTSRDCTLRVLDIQTLKFRTTRRFEMPINCTAMTPCRKGVCVVGDDPTTRILDMLSGMTIIELPGHLAPSYACAWAPNGRFLATGSMDMTTRIYDTRNFTSPLAILPSRMTGVQSIKFSDDSRFMTFSELADFVHIVDLKAPSCDQGDYHYCLVNNRKSKYEPTRTSIDDYLSMDVLSSQPQTIEDEQPKKDLQEIVSMGFLATRTSELLKKRINDDIDSLIDYSESRNQLKLNVERNQSEMNVVDVGDDGKQSSNDSAISGINSCKNSEDGSCQSGNNKGRVNGINGDEEDERTNLSLLEKNTKRVEAKMLKIIETDYDNVLFYGYNVEALYPKEICVEQKIWCNRKEKENKKGKNVACCNDSASMNVGDDEVDGTELLVNDDGQICTFNEDNDDEVPIYSIVQGITAGVTAVTAKLPKLDNGYQVQYMNTRIPILNTPCKMDTYLNFDTFTADAYDIYFPETCLYTGTSTSLLKGRSNAFRSTICDVFGELAGIDFTPGGNGEGPSNLYIGVVDSLYGGLIEYEKSAIGACYDDIGCDFSGIVL